MKPFILLISTFLILGLMDHIKFHYYMTLFSKITKPAFLVRWLDPTKRMIEKAPRWLMLLLNSPLAAVNDLWHFLKFLLIECIIYLAWLSHNEGKWWAFFLIMNAAYGVLFETVFTSDWRKEKGAHSTDMVYPKIVTWYYEKFPRKTYGWIMVGLVIIGVVLTSVGLSPAIPTWIVCGMVAAWAPLFVVVWARKRRAER